VRSLAAKSVLTIGLLVFAVAGQNAQAATPRLADADGLHVTSVKQLDPRLTAVTVTTPALAGTANIWILLPTGYAEHPHKRYPVLYLFHGTSGTASDWVKQGDAEATTAGRPLIVVMPDIALNVGGGGWCTNWVNGGSYGTPKWETFHIQQVIPWVDQNLRSIPVRNGRAIAGLSQGGFCSMSYAARHPDKFISSLAYSGAVETSYDLEAQVASTAIVNLTEVALDGVAPNSMFGDRVSNEINWAAHDPGVLANNLRGMNLYMYTGNGRAGPLDPSPFNPGGTAIEAPVHEDNVLFHARLNSLGIPSYYRDYGAGTHSWPYWTRDLRESIGPLMDDFADPPPPPSRVTYTSGDSEYSSFGWQVTMHRSAREFSTLQDADAKGFRLAGSGAGSVITPPMYKARRAYSVRLVGDTVQRRATIRAGRDRRLRIEVPLGPGNRDQQYSLMAALSGTKIFNTRVSISRLRPARAPARALARSTR
jgi:S-formylglutathione hydrolase FrmB